MLQGVDFAQLLTGAGTALGAVVASAIGLGVSIVLTKRGYALLKSFMR